MQATITFNHCKKLHFIFFIFIILFGIHQYSYSQKKIKVKNVKGSCVISNITPEEAREKAIQRAKQDALRRAGIGEVVSASNIYNREEINDEFVDFFNSITSTELEGKVTSYEVTHEEKTVDQFDNLIYEVEINATVVKYKSEKDPEFDFKVEGIKQIYDDTEKLRFSFLPYKDGYLRIFLIDDNENSYSIFPNEHEKIRMFQEGVKTEFPINVNYTLEAAKPIDNDLLVFVFTKKNIPFKEEENYNNILEWIYSMPRDQRMIQYFPFTIRQ